MDLLLICCRFVVDCCKIVVDLLDNTSTTIHNKSKLEKVAIIAMYCHLRPPHAIAIAT